jgi:hypothetical protein
MNDWVILKAEKEGKVSLCRLRKTAPPALFSTLINIEWTYDGSEYNGFPSPDLRKTMDQLEDYIAPLCDSSTSRLMTVLTGLGLREWGFYSNDFNIFIEKFNEYMQGKPVVPIKINYSQDPEHKYWMKYRNNVKESC